MKHQQPTLINSREAMRVLKFPVSEEINPKTGRKKRLKVERLEKLNSDGLLSTRVQLTKKGFWYSLEECLELLDKCARGQAKLT